MIGLIREQPPAFRMIFMLELWERFGFYTVQGLIILFLMRTLGHSDVEAYYIFGAFTALLYGMVILGGYLGDQVLGTKRTIICGLIILLAGYLALALTDNEHVYLALGLICVGGGIFKANPSNLLSKCYKEGDLRLHAGFTLYYMAINLGSIGALILGPAISSKYGYSYAYFLSAIGLMIALANYWFQRNLVASINTEIDKRKIGKGLWLGLLALIIVLVVISEYLLMHITITKWLLIIVSFLAVLRYFLYMRGQSKAVCTRMVVALVLMLEAIIFYTLYQQMPSSINLFAVNNVIPTIFGLTFDPQSFQVLNPIWIILISPILARLYHSLSRRGIGFSITYKFALGMTFCSISFLVLYFARFFYIDNGQVASWWLISSYFFQSIGELLVSALGLAMVAELVPTQITGYVMGMWWLASALAGYTGAYAASYAALPEHLQPSVESLMIYTHVFGGIGLVTLVIAVLMWLGAPVLSRFIRHSHQL